MSGGALARYRGVRCLVLGASGFIGRWVARQLAAHEAELWLVSRRADSLRGLSGTAVECDLGDDNAVAQLFASVRPSVTFNLAGYGVHPSERDETTARAINARLPRLICQALQDRDDAAWSGLRLVHTGSAAEYGKATGVLSERSPAKPETLYGKTKLAGTEAVRQCGGRSGLRAATVRLFTVYGPGEHPGRLLPSLMECARTGAALELSSGRQLRSFTYVEDAAEGLLRAGLTRLEGEVVNLASGDLASVRHFVAVASRLLGIAAAQLRFGVKQATEWEMPISAISTGRANELLDWLPLTPLEEGIGKTLRADHAVQTCGGR